MKNTLILIGAGALLATATACGDNHDDNDMHLSKSSIAFTASVPYAQTNRSVITTQNINEFTVYGYIGNELYMNALRVTKEGNNWTYSPIYYWPVGEAVDFYSYAPASVIEKGTLLTANDNFRIDDYVNDGTTDFIYAVNKNEKVNNSSAASSHQVKVNFRHAMSKIAVLFSKKANTGDFKFFVRNVNLVNAYGQGNFIYPNRTTAAGEMTDDNSGHWERQSSLGTASINTSTVGPVTAASGAMATNSTGYMFVMPQDIREYDANVPNSAGMYFEVECQFQNGATDHVIWPNASVAGQTADGYATIRIPIRNRDNDDWESGHSYVYTISLDVPEEGSTKITFDVTVDDYEDYGNTVLD